MLKKHKMRQKRQRLRFSAKSRRFHHIYRIKRRIHSRYRVGFMLWQS